MENLDILHVVWQSGLVVKLVLVVLILASVISLSIVWKKLNYLREMKSNDKIFWQSLRVPKIFGMPSIGHNYFRMAH